MCTMVNNVSELLIIFQSKVFITSHGLIFMNTISIIVSSQNIPFLFEEWFSRGFIYRCLNFLQE